jgi:subtilisin family serine protease
MKSIAHLALIGLVFLGTISLSHAKEYIIKLDQTNQPNLQTLSQLTSLGQLQDLEVSLGSFYKLKTRTSINSSIIKNPPAGIEYIEPNIQYEQFEAVNDPMFEEQWALKNTGDNSGRSWLFPGVAGMDINILQAWTQTKGRRSIRIGVIDGGVDYTHEDIRENMMVNLAEKNGETGVDDDGNGYVDDIYGYDFGDNDSDPEGSSHGTHVAGSIGAVHNQLGIAGVMSDVQLLSIRMFGKKGGSLESAIKSIDYGIKREVDILSNSWGGGKFSQALKDAIKRAEEAGIVFVVAAGNYNHDNDKRPIYPASYDVSNIIAVGSHNSEGEKASHSCYGRKTVDVFAPGVDVLSSVPGNDYEIKTGTSMATPHVSGVVGLILSLYPDLTPAEVRQRLIETSTRKGVFAKYGQGGMVNAHNAVLGAIPEQKP